MQATKEFVLLCSVGHCGMVPRSSVEWSWTMLTNICDYLGYRVWIRDTSYSVRRILITSHSYKAVR